MLSDGPPDFSPPLLFTCCSSAHYSPVLYSGLLPPGLCQITDLYRHFQHLLPDISSCLDLCLLHFIPVSELFANHCLTVTMTSSLFTFCLFTINYFWTFVSRVVHFLRTWLTVKQWPWRGYEIASACRLCMRHMKQTLAVTASDSTASCIFPIH